MTRQNGRIYRTTDGGTTWLPQFYNPNVDNNPMVLSQICFDRSGFGVVQKRYMAAAWDTIFYSTDLGDTYQPFPRRMSPLGDNTRSVLFKFDTTITLITTYTTYKLGHLIYQFDTTLRERSYTVLDSVFIFSIWRSGDTLWSWRVNYRRPISFQLTFSLDRGNNWQIAQEYLNDRVAPNSFVAGNLDNLLFRPIGKYLVCGRDEGYWKKETNIYIYDTETRRWLDDTLNIPGGWLGGSINRIGNKVVLNHGYWDVIGKQILYGDSPVSPQKWKTATYPGTTCGVNSSFEDSDIAYCIVVSNNTTHLYKVMVDTSSLTSVNEPKIEGGPTLVYAFPPYPNPASRSVRALIYWDRRIPFGTASCEIYNALGEPIERGERITMQYTNDYHGELVWDCSQVTAGAYYILIRHGSATTVVPVLVQHE
ncbi:MAG: hypothetical protein LC116_00150 [Bacteroidetes bacterium]|nr:hypothetical protein [Bacteroidota bacterium]MCZ2131597.1 hypothetical protein [Bacteroidota bacterium]